MDNVQVLNLVEAEVIDTLKTFGEFTEENLEQGKMAIMAIFKNKMKEVLKGTAQAMVELTEENGELKKIVEDLEKKESRAIGWKEGAEAILAGFKNAY